MYDESTIETVREGGEYFDVSTVDHTGFGLHKKYGVTPRPGDKIGVWTVNGSEIRGVKLNGKTVFYLSDKELEAEHLRHHQEYEREQKERFDRERASLDSDYQSLPENFKKRISRFRKNNPNFRWEYEAYEMFVCKQAVAIAAACGTPEKIRSFHDMPWEEAKALCPELSDGHSGNTFGAACHLAYLHLAVPDKVYLQHGSLSPLVGSEAFGDIDK